MLERFLSEPFALFSSLDTKKTYYLDYNLHQQISMDMVN